jgi:hypothetical protein
MKESANTNESHMWSTGIKEASRKEHAGKLKTHEVPKHRILSHIGEQKKPSRVRTQSKHERPWESQWKAARP